MKAKLNTHSLILILDVIFLKAGSQKKCQPDRKIHTALKT